MTSVKAQREQFCSDPNTQHLNRCAGLVVGLWKAEARFKQENLLRAFLPPSLHVEVPTSGSVVQMCPLLPDPLPFAISVLSLPPAVLAELQLRPTESRPAAKRLQLQHAGEQQTSHRRAFGCSVRW